MTVHESAAHELRALQGARILVLGDVMLDRYLERRCGAHVAGGAGARTAGADHPPRPRWGGQRGRQHRSVGARVALIGRVGDDADAGELVGLLDSSGIEHALTVVSGVPTTTKTRAGVGREQVARIDRETVHPSTPDEIGVILDVGGPVPGRGRTTRGVVLADYAKGFFGPELLHQIITRAGRADVPVVTDPKSRDIARYAGSTVVKPNLAEARAACPDPVEVDGAEDEVTRLADAYLRLSGARNVVLSCSADGVALLGSDCAALTRLPTVAREVADVSGAGDTLIALVALGLAAGLGLLRTVEIANAAAGAVCGKPGTATLSATELLALMGAGDRPASRRSEPEGALRSRGGGGRRRPVRAGGSTPGAGQRLLRPAPRRPHPPAAGGAGGR